MHPFSFKRPYGYAWMEHVSELLLSLLHSHLKVLMVMHGWSMVTKYSGLT